MTTVAELLSEAAARLKPVSETPRLDAELLLAHVLKRDRTWLFTWPEHRPDAAEAERFRDLLAGRAGGKPVAWLVGEREFFGHRFRVTPDTLVPRPDTELLVEVVLREMPSGAIDLVDLGTGTGAVGITLALARPAWQVLLTDRHPQTLAVARDNARQLNASNVRCLASDWLWAVDGRFDAVVSNPPYIRANDEHLEQGDVRHERRGALVAGVDGLDDIRVIIEQAWQHLDPGGLLALEHGHDQGEAVRELMAKHGFGAVTTEPDLAGNERVTHGRKDAQ